MADVLLNIPMRPQSAPATITLSEPLFGRPMRDAMDEMWKDSFYEDKERVGGVQQLPNPRVKEWTFTIVIDKITRKFEICGLHTDGYDSVVSAAKITDRRLRGVGLVHTHPSRIRTGLRRALDSEDAKVMLKNKLNFMIAMSGTNSTFLYLNTALGGWGPVASSWIAEQTQKEIKEISLNWNSDFSDLTDKLAAETAEHLNIAYYRGTGLSLQRVWPPTKTQTPPVRKQKWKAAVRSR